MESTFVILKPNAVQRALVGEITSRFEKRGLRIAAMKMVSMDGDLALKLYREHEGKPFFSDLIAFITSGPSVVMVLEAEQAVSIVRSMIGATDPAVAHPGTIRGDYAVSTGHNMIHASDSTASAQREIGIFFSSGELSDYSLAVKPWL